MREIYPSGRQDTAHLATYSWQRCYDAGYREATKDRHSFAINLHLDPVATYKALKKVHERHGAFDDVVRTNGLEGAAHVIRSYTHVLSASADGQMLLAMLPDFCEFGFPVVTMGHKFAASLMVTKPATSVLPLVRPPFQAFRIEVPEDLIIFTDDVGQECSVKDIYVSRLPGLGKGASWVYVAYSKSHTALWRYHHNIGFFLTESETELLPDGTDPGLGETNVKEFLTPLGQAFNLEMEDVDSRAAALIGRLVVNTCLAMTGPDRVKKRGKAHKYFKSEAVRHSPPPPNFRRFEVTAPVKHDFRETVVSYIRRGGSSPSVQGVVAGHWKMQAHGPRMSQRKLIHVEPYWRGPEDAPIAVRPHELR